jgi:hypothetical protein
MSIRDLLWACPECGTFASIQDRGRGSEQCDSCRAEFRRGPRASIEIRRADGSARRAAAAELVDGLPDAESMLLRRDRLGPVPALVRVARRSMPVRDGDDYLGRAEIFGPATEATITLDDLTLAAGIPEEPMVWPLEAITALQPSSATLQINSRIHPLVSLRFPAHSVRLWEELLQHRISAVHERAGRGRVSVFHPHIRFD